MNESDEYILETIKSWVWSGFYSRDEVDEMIEDILEEDADEEMLRLAIPAEFKKKAAAEASWPATTDCDRLDKAFAELNAQGIIALQNAGYTMSDGLEDVGEALRESGRKNIRGYAFYHGQDLQRAVEGGGLTLAYGDLNDDKAKRTEIGHAVKETLERHGLTVDWPGDGDKRITLPTIDWKRRYRPA